MRSVSREVNTGAYSQLRAQVLDQVGYPVWWQVDDRVGYPVWWQVDDRVEDPVLGRVEEESKDHA